MKPSKEKHNFCQIDYNKRIFTAIGTKTARKAAQKYAKHPLVTFL